MEARASVGPLGEFSEWPRYNTTIGFAGCPYGRHILRNGMCSQILASVASRLPSAGALSVTSLSLTMPPSWTGSLWCTAGISSCPQAEVLMDTMLRAGYIPWVVPILVFAELLITRGRGVYQRIRHSGNRHSEPHAGESRTMHTSTGTRQLSILLFTGSTTLANATDSLTRRALSLCPTSMT